jgi:hypothetical protein
MRGGFHKFVGQHLQKMKKQYSDIDFDFVFDGMEIKV